MDELLITVDFHFKKEPGENWAEALERFKRILADSGLDAAAITTR